MRKSNQRHERLLAADRLLAPFMEYAVDAASARVRSRRQGPCQSNQHSTGIGRRLCCRRSASLRPFMEYAVDAAQRSVLFWDVMRQRGNQYREHLAETAPHVLNYKVELVMDGRTFERPVNYVLARVLSPGRRRDRSEAAAVRDRRSARRTRPGHRRLQGRQRNRRRLQGRPSLLFRRLPSRSDARPDHRGHRPCRGASSSRR